MLTDLIYYDLKVAALIAVFYLFYRLLLARETTHTLNRIVLLTGIALSAVLPLCIITIHKTYPQPLPRDGEYIDPLTNISQAVSTTELPTHLSLGEGLGVGLLFAMLLIGTIVRLLYVGQSYIKLQRLLRGGEMHILPSGTKVCVVDTPIAPFSWMQTVVLSRDDWHSSPLEKDRGWASILAHEEAHVRHRHSYDIVVVEVLTALQWFNPVVWYLRQELRILHEYEADASVLSHGFNESQYIHLLMRKATGIQACVLANGINTPKTKKRILMMLKPKSKRGTWLKALYVVPIVLVSLAMTAKTVIDYETIPNDNNSSVRMFHEKTNKRGDCYQIRHQPGVKFYRNGKEEQIPEGRSIALEVSKTTMQINGKPIDQITLLDFPEGALKEIYLTEIESDKFVCNMVTEKSKGKTVCIVDGKMVSEDEVSNLRHEDIDNVSVINTTDIIKKVFNVDADEAIVVQTKQQGDDQIFDLVEQMPQFPGGEVKLMEFLAKNSKYPEIATENGVQGRVLVRFIVEKDGSLTSPEVVTKPAIGKVIPIEVIDGMTEKERQDAEAHNAGVKALQEEAIRVVKAMPKWIPGKQKGKAVRCRFTIPVVYRLS